MNYKNMGSSLEAKDSLARQLSVYSLTFDEFQTTIGGPGKDFGSMNMDEFLKNIWTAEESYAMASASVPGGLEIAKTDGGLQRQGSLTLPRTLSQKTVDEVWRGLLGGQPEFQQERQPTLGEMTLEEFLVKAGVVMEDMNQSAAGPIINNGNNSVFYSELPSNSNPGLALGFAQPNSLANVSAAMPRAYPVPLSVGNGGELASPQGMRAGGMVGIRDSVLNNGLMSGVVGLGGSRVTVAAAASPVNQVLSDGLMKGNEDLSSLSPVPYVFGGGMKRRKCSGAVEKVVERRQKRMIKNRESAARSRARKQAYTMELEAEVAKLKDKNEELEKKQVEIMEMQKNQVLEMINQQHLPKKRCLRRTQTGPW